MQSQDYDFRLPRLLVDASLSAGSDIPLSADQTHYLKTVLRRPDGAQVRLFNGRDGEWLASITFSGKKSATLTLDRQIRPTTSRALKLHLIFAPIKKDRMDFMIEKAVELGVTDLHPVLTSQTTIRDLNAERVTKQINEAAEQCERLDLPTLHPLQSLKNIMTNWAKDIPVFAALERENLPFIGKITPVHAEAALLIGPEGGFSEEERQSLIANDRIKPVSLGDQILRTETAAIFGLSALLTNFTE